MKADGVVVRGLITQLFNVSTANEWMEVNVKQVILTIDKKLYQLREVKIRKSWAISTVQGSTFGRLNQPGQNLQQGATGSRFNNLGGTGQQYQGQQQPIQGQSRTFGTNQGQYAQTGQGQYGQRGQGQFAQTGQGQYSQTGTGNSQRQYNSLQGQGQSRNANGQNSLWNPARLNQMEKSPQPVYGGNNQRSQSNTQQNFGTNNQRNQPYVNNQIRQPGVGFNQNGQQSNQQGGQQGSSFKTQLGGSFNRQSNQPVGQQGSSFKTQLGGSLNNPTGNFGRQQGFGNAGGSAYNNQGLGKDIRRVNDHNLGQRVDTLRNKETQQGAGYQNRQGMSSSFKKTGESEPDYRMRILKNQQAGQGQSRVQGGQQGQGSLTSGTQGQGQDFKKSIKDKWDTAMNTIKTKADTLPGLAQKAIEVGKKLADDTFGKKSPALDDLARSRASNKDGLKDIKVDEKVPIKSSVDGAEKSDKKDFKPDEKMASKSSVDAKKMDVGIKSDKPKDVEKRDSGLLGSISKIKDSKKLD